MDVSVLFKYLGFDYHRYANDTQVYKFFLATVHAIDLTVQQFQVCNVNIMHPWMRFNLIQLNP